MSLVEPPLGLLTCVNVVRRAQPQLDTLPHVVRAIDGFVDQSHLWTLEAATLKGLVHLLDRLAPREHPGMKPSFRESRFMFNVKQASARGFVIVIQWWMKTYLPKYLLSYWPIMIPAIEHGQLHVLQWALAQETPTSYPLYSLSCDHAAVVCWIREQRLPLRLYCNVDEVAKTGDLEFMKWLQKNQMEMIGSSNALVIAMERGYFDMVVWLVENQPAFLSFNEQLFSAHSAQSTDFGRNEWPNRSYPSSYFELPEPLEVTEGHIRLCRWFATEYKWQNTLAKGSWADKTVLHASACGNIEILEIISEQSHLWDETTHHRARYMHMAASRGHSEVVKWIHAKRCRFNKHVLDGAAIGGCMDIVQLMFSEPRALSKYAGCEAMDLAAAYNRLDIVQFLHKHGLEHCCSTKAMDMAAANGHHEVVRWLHANRTEGCTVMAMDDAAANGHLTMVQWLQAKYSELRSSHTLDRAAAAGQLHVVQYVHSQGQIPCTKAGTKGAASNGHLNVVQWLHANRPDAVWTQEAIDQAAENGHLAVVTFLSQNVELRCSNSAIRRLSEANRFAVAEWIAAHWGICLFS